MKSPGGAPLAVDRWGNRLLAFTPGVESDVAPANVVPPCPCSLVTVWCGPCCLMVFDRWRQQWELPGGGREPDESPRVAAIRELHEETGRELPELDYVGTARFALSSDGRVELGALYRARIEHRSALCVPNS